MEINGMPLPHVAILVLVFLLVGVPILRAIQKAIR